MWATCNVRQNDEMYVTIKTFQVLKYTPNKRNKLGFEFPTRFTVRVYVSHDKTNVNRLIFCNIDGLLWYEILFINVVFPTIYPTIQGLFIYPSTFFYP